MSIPASESAVRFEAILQIWAEIKRSTQKLTAKWPRFCQINYSSVIVFIESFHIRAAFLHFKELSTDYFNPSFDRFAAVVLQYKLQVRRQTGF